MIPTDKLRAEIKRLGDIVPWYHRFVFLDGTIIPGWEGIYPIWNMIRGVRSSIDYRGARVLDLGSRDGMWAFEAESMGAAKVIATDIGCEGYREHITFIKVALGSRVGIYFNVPTEDAFNRLDVFFVESPGLFDVVQHLGLLYHLENPMASLRSTRKCLKLGGTLLLETAYFTMDTGLPAALFNSNDDIYTDPNTYWAFNRRALLAALKLTGFKADESSIKTMYQSSNVGRICLTAEAV